MCFDCLDFMKDRPSGEDNCHLAGNREGFPGGATVKNPPANAGNAKVGSIPGWGRSPGGGNGNLHRYSCLENSMDRGAWQTTVPGVTKKWNKTEQLYTAQARKQKIFSVY